MKFRYLGDSKKMVAYGHDFRDGNEPDVEDANAVKRLSGNRFFEEVTDLAKLASLHVFPDELADSSNSAAKTEAPKKRPGRKPKTA